MDLALPNILYGPRIRRFLNSADLRALDDLHSAQTQALAAFAEDIAQGETRLYAEMPTGAGKTRLSLALILAMSNGGALPRTLIVVPTHKILQGTLDEIRDYMPNWLNDGLVGEYHGHEKNLRTPITLTTYQSLLLGTGRLHFRPDNIDMIVFDEAHHALSENRQRVSAMYEDTLQIGLTASATYSAEKTLDNSFRRSYYLSHGDAVARGIIPPSRNFMLLTEGFSLDEISMEGGDFNQQQLAKLTDDAGRYKQIAQFIEHWADPETGKRLLDRTILAPCATIKQAENAAAYFNRYFKAYMPKGQRFATAIHSALTDSEQLALDTDFRAGKIRMVVTPKLLIEGYDNERINTVLNITPTASAVLAKQRGGRATRLDDNDPDKEAWVIDAVDQAQARKSLFYAEVIGGARFFRASDLAPIEVDSSKLDKALSAFWKNGQEWLKTGPRVITPDGLIDLYAQKNAPKVVATPEIRDKALAQLMPSIVEIKGTKREFGTRGIDDPMLPSLRRAMTDTGYVSVRQIWQKWKDARGWELDYHLMLRLAKGQTRLRGKDSQLLPETLVFSEVIGHPLDRIFASHNDYERNARREDWLRSHEAIATGTLHETDSWARERCLPKIRAALEKYNYANVSAVAMTLSMEMGYFPFFAYSHLKDAATGARPVAYLSPRHEGVIPNSIRLFCEFLGSTPEDLFSEDQYFEELERRRHREDNLQLTETFMPVGQYYKPPVRGTPASKNNPSSLVFTFGRAADFTPVTGPQVPPRWATWDPEKIDMDAQIAQNAPGNYRTKWKNEWLLPNIRAVMEKHGIENLRGLHHLLCEAYPDKGRPQYEILARICLGVGSAAYPNHKRYTPSRLGKLPEMLCAFLKEDPSVLFAEDQYFAHAKAMSENNKARAALDSFGMGGATRMGIPLKVVESDAYHNTAAYRRRDQPNDRPYGIRIQFLNDDSAHPVGGPQHPPRFMTWQAPKPAPRPAP